MVLNRCKEPVWLRLDLCDILVNGFFSVSEKKEIIRFHRSEDRNKAAVCETFVQGRVKDMARRILSRNFENYSLAETNREYSDHLRRLFSKIPEDAIKGYRDDIKYGAVQGLCDIEEIQKKEKELSPLQEEILAWLKGHVKKISALTPGDQIHSGSM
jgi:exonuclease I